MFHPIGMHRTHSLGGLAAASANVVAADKKAGEESVQVLQMALCGKLRLAVARVDRLAKLEPHSIRLDPQRSLANKELPRCALGTLE